ncbi:hypothetical protein ACOSP7_029223 [Xanthoceras sorbifolium]
MENTSTSMASQQRRARPVVHRRSSSDSQMLSMDVGDNFSLLDHDLESQVGDHANNPSSLVEANLFAESSINVDQAPKRSTNPVPEDPKKMKRLIANRESAHRSRMRKQEYTMKLEKSIDLEQAKLSLLNPQVAYYENHYKRLIMENDAMKKRMAALVIKKAIQDAEFEELTKQKEALSRNIMKRYTKE